MKLARRNFSQMCVYLNIFTILQCLHSLTYVYCDKEYRIISQRDNFICSKLQNAKVHGLPGGGARGMLISTYTGKELQAAREAINILSEAYESMCPEVADAKNEVVGGDKGGDISALLANEVADLKDYSKQDFGSQLLGINGLVFVQVKYEGGPSPTELVQHVCREVKASKQNKTRLCQRFYPVEHQCTADLEDMQKMAKEVLPNHFPADSTEGITVRF